MNYVVKKSVTTIVAMILLLPTELSASKYAAEFLRIGIGARALGMGGAFVAIADNGTASYWNPAGLANLSRHQVLLSHVQLFDNLAKHNFANLSIKLSNNLGVGVSWIRMAVDDIPRYAPLEGNRYDRILNPDLRSTGLPQGYFGDVEDALFISMGRGIDFDLAIGGGMLPATIPMRVGIGISYKYISQKLDLAKGNGQGIDAGVLIKFNTHVVDGGRRGRTFAFGVNFQDVTGTTIVWNTGSHTRDQLPPNLLYGISYVEHFPFLDSWITLSLCRNNHYEKSNHWGGEFVFKNMITLRAGSKNGNFTAGAGIKIFWLQADYAFVSYDLGNSHRISGTVEF